MRKVPTESGLLVQLFMARWGLVDENSECNALVQRLFRQYVENGFDAGFGATFGNLPEEDEDGKDVARNHMHLPQHIKKAAKRLLDEKGGDEIPSEAMVEPLVAGSRVSVKRVRQYLHGLAKRKRRLSKRGGLEGLTDENDALMHDDGADV